MLSWASESRIGKEAVKEGAMSKCHPLGVGLGLSGEMNRTGLAPMTEILLVKLHWRQEIWIW